MLKKLFPFLFKKEEKKTGEKSHTAARSNGRTRPLTSTIASDADLSFGLIGRNRNHRGLRKGSKVYVRQIFDDGDRLRVRGTAPNGKKVTLTLNRRSLKDYESEAVPSHLEKHYNEHSLFADEHEAKVKAEALGKH